MTQEQRPITPPPELVLQWVSLACEYEGNETWIDLATQAARWGADQELEACCEYMQHEDFHGFARELRAARRPKPPSLKELALRAIGAPAKIGEARVIEHREHELIRRALAQLPDE